MKTDSHQISTLRSEFQNTLIEWSCQLVVALLYVLFGYITNKYLLNHGIVSTVWLGSGVALAALLLGGWRYLWGAFFGMFAFNILQGHSFVGVVGITLANVLEVIVGFWLVSKKGVVSQSVLQNYLKLIMFGGGLASIVGGVMGASTLLVMGSITSADYLKNILTWWMGDTLGVVLLVPLALIWSKKKLTRIQGKQWIEGFFLVCVTFFVGQIVFLDWFHEFLSNSRKGYLMFFFVSIVAIRMGMRGVTLIVLITAIQAMLSAYLKIGFFANEIMASELRNYWLYIVVLSSSGVSLASYVDKVNRIMQQLQTEINERKQIEINLQASENRFKDLFDNAPLPYQSLDINGNFLHVNQAWLELTGCKHDEVIGEFFGDFMTESSKKLIYQTFCKFKAEGHITSPVFELVRRDTGEERLVIVEGKVARDNQGMFQRTHCILTDVTKRYGTEQKLKESEARFRTIIDISPVPMALNDNNQNIIFLNCAFVETFGYDLNDIPTLQTWWEKAYPDANYRQWVLETWQAILEQAIRENKAFVPFELKVCCKNGSQKTILASATIVSEKADNLHLVVLYDITVQKQTEQNLIEGQFRWKFAIEGSSDGLWDWCIPDNTVFFSPRWKEMLGFSDDEIKNVVDEWEKRIHPDDKSHVIKTVETYLEGRTPIYTLEHRVRCKDGNYKWILARGMVVSSDENGKPLRMIGTHTDITERKDLENELKRSNADLEQFAYAISHDMRQPLRMVTSYLSLIEKALQSQLDDDTHQFLTFAVDGAKRMDAMILSLLDYSRVGKSTEAFSIISTRAALDEALLFLKPELESCNGNVDVSGDWINLVANHDELTRLFQNLIGNGLKYHKEGESPHLEVSALVTANIFRVEVRDNGIGIAPNQLDRLFKVFSRLQARTRFEGTGVGLALCRKIVEHHGGKIGVKSEGEGLGCSFWFELPQSSRLG